MDRDQVIKTLTNSLRVVLDALVLFPSGNHGTDHDDTYRDIDAAPGLKHPY